jgi:hypothetical protein
MSVVDVGLNAAGILGVALETTYGEYEAPTKFIPVRSETLEVNQEVIERRVIRQLAGLVGVVQGNMHVEGDVEIEVLDDAIVYFLAAARTEVVKTGGPTDFEYSFTPGHSALPPSSLSITVVRNDEVFGFVGCIVGTMAFSFDEGMLIANLSVVGANEAEQGTPMNVVWPDSIPFGPGNYTLELPINTVVIDTDMDMTMTIEDNATPEFRLEGDHGATFARFGERSINMSLTRDFTSRADFDGFKSVTAQSMNFKAERSGTNFIEFDFPVIVKTSYSVGLAAQGDLTRGSIEYVGVSGPTVEYTITVGTQEDIDIGAS